MPPEKYYHEVLLQSIIEQYYSYYPFRNFEVQIVVRREPQIEQQLIQDVVLRWAGSNQQLRISPITPDASLRRYFRAHLSSPINGHASCIVMLFDSVTPPEVGAGPVINSDTAYRELSELFLQNKVAVPEFFLDASDVGMFVIEDLGDQSLASVALEKGKALSENEILRFYTLATEQILKFQQVTVRVAGPKNRTGAFAFQRAFGPALYQKEMSEYDEFVLAPSGAHDQIRKLCQTHFETLAHELNDFPKVLVHRDFHSWNLMVDTHEQIRVIDFQDALMGPCTYDVVALINDRDTDTGLGEKVYSEILKHFFQLLGRPANFPTNLLDEYDRVLLQRDLKVAGRFEKLSAVRGLTQYKKWVPGTKRRIGRTLARLCSRGAPEYLKNLLDMLSQNDQDVALGVADPWKLFEVN